MEEMISFGAGINSVAMAILLVEEGWTGQIVFADTGAEHPETYCYMQYFERVYLAPRGLYIVRLEHGSEYHSKDGSLEEYCLKYHIIPLLAVRWCTVGWKHNPLDRWMKANGIGRTAIGFTIDEGGRERHDGVRYPLDERGVTRPECMRIIQRAGLDVPRKSGCFFCPGQPLAQWRALYMDHPDLYERAIALEDNASAYNQKHATLDPHGISLREHRRRRWEGQTQMDLTEWIPCLCKV